MILTRLKYWRELRGYSLRELEGSSKVPYSAISLLENLKREPQGRTARKLAAALEVEVAELYELPAAPEPPVQPMQIIPAPINDNKTQTVAIKLPRSRSIRSKGKTVISFWVIEKDQEEADPFKVGTQAEAERLKVRLGGQHQARVYEAASKLEAWELHRKFLIRVIRGHDGW